MGIIRKGVCDATGKPTLHPRACLEHYASVSQKGISFEIRQRSPPLYPVVFLKPKSAMVSACSVPTHDERYPRERKLSKNRLRQWAIDVWRWLGEAELVFMGIFVGSAAALLGFLTWHSEQSIRVAGYALQLIGMVFAIRGLLSIREHFGQPLLRHLLLIWIKRFPKWKKSVVVAANSVHMTTVTSKARVEDWTPDYPEKPVHQRIDAIIKNLDRIRNEQQEHARLIDELKDSHEKHKKQFEKENKKIREDIRSDRESLHTSDLITSLMGLVWLTVGITMSTLAPEFSKWLH